MHFESGVIRRSRSTVCSTACSRRISEWLRCTHLRSCRSEILSASQGYATFAPPWAGIAMSLRDWKKNDGECATSSRADRRSEQDGERELSSWIGTSCCVYCPGCSTGGPTVLINHPFLAALAESTRSRRVSMLSAHQRRVIVHDLPTAVDLPEHEREVVFELLAAAC